MWAGTCEAVGLQPTLVFGTRTLLPGGWGFSGRDELGPLQIGMGFYGDGSFAYVMNVHHANGRYQEFKDTGRWSIAGNQLAFETSKGVDYCDFELREDQLFIYFPHLKMTVDFVPMQ